MNLQRYTVQDNNLDFHVVVEVDRDLLTAEMAHEVNNFWGNAEMRLRQCEGNVEVAVVRLFARTAISLMLADGGADFDDQSKVGLTIGGIWTKDIHENEGWPGADYLKVVEAYVFTSEFEDLEATAC